GSLVGVFIPMLFMGGLPGRLFREFAVTLSVAILVSLLISLTLTPMMCARMLRVDPKRAHGGAAEVEPPRTVRRSALRRLGDAFWSGYRRSLNWALAHSRLTLAVLLATVGLNVYLYTIVPKGYFPQQDTGQLMGFFRVDQGMS